MKERYGNLSKNILLGLINTGAAMAKIASPDFVLSITKQTIRDKEYLKENLEKIKIRKAFEKLRKNRLVILREDNGKFLVELTEEGKRKVKEIQLEKLKIEKPPKWDKKWRIIIFDIPNRKSRARDALRYKIKELNLYLLQKSVWVCPYPCEKEIQFLCELFNITPYVNVITAENIANDVKLRKHFNLL